jgi:hypothetical protein
MRIKDYFQMFDIDPISANPLHGPITQDLVEQLQRTNEEKRQRSIELLGNKWLLHPDNKEQRKDFQ